MPEYRFYKTGQTNRFLDPPAIRIYASDAEAVMDAMAFASAESGIEVWDSARLVCRVPPKVAGNSEVSAAP